MALLDLRSHQTKEGAPGAGKVVHGALVERDTATIDTICLHQTAVFFGVAPYQLKAARGDALLAQFLRALGVHAHVTAFDEGTFVPSYPLRSFLWHGNGANARSIGLEIEGYYNGQPGGALNGHPGGARTEPTERTIATAREACSWIVDACKLEGIIIRHYVAHRQYSTDRRSDPGWSIWQNVGIEHCEKTLGLSPLLDLVDGGMAIPRSWDARSSHEY